MELFDFQKEGSNFLAQNVYAYLADEMGLGKTIQAIHALNKLNLKKILIVCPAVARFNWRNEIETFTPEKTYSFAVIKTKEDTRQDYLKDVTIISYDLADEFKKNTLEPRGNPYSFDLIILDEAHYLKSPKARRTLAVLGKQGVIRYSKRVWLLSGTPAPNHAGELWPVLFTFKKTTLSFDQFTRRYCNYYETTWGRQITGTKRRNMPELKRLFANFMLRRTKGESGLRLPAVNYEHFSIEPEKIELDEYSSFFRYSVSEEMTEKLEDRLKRERDLLDQMFKVMFHPDNKSTMMNIRHDEDALRSIAPSVATLRRYTGIQKINEIVKMVSDELRSNCYQKIVIFAVHRDVIIGLYQGLRAFKPVTLFGGHPDHKKERAVYQFQNVPSKRVFIGNIQAAGTAITLTAAHQVLFVEQDWVPGNNAQAAMRCHRIGQKKMVTVRIVSLKDSVDQKVNAVLLKKTKELLELFDENELPSFTETSNQGLDPFK